MYPDSDATHTTVQDRNRSKRVLTASVCILAVIGPVIPLTVTWKPSLGITGIRGETPDHDTVRQLRSVPGDVTLDEIDKLSVAAGGLGISSDSEIVAAAEHALDGQMSVDKNLRDVRVPETGFNAIFDDKILDLKFCSLIVPNMLVRAFEVSGDVRYLNAAVVYVLEWAKFEASLTIPSGLVFNDHATAARAIVVTEVWRHYRKSESFEESRAVELLTYVQKISNLLRYQGLYEYRTNHGIMQSLSLLHLAIAFPLLDKTDENFQVGKRRLLAQLEYYVNEEGVILEHSPGYHQNGLRRLAAAWRYLGLKGDPVPDGYVKRYRKALDFLAALRRPDRTLPPIGDTDNRPYSSVQIATFANNLASEPLRDESAGIPMPAPAPLTAAPGAGWVIRWDGLAQWPDASKLTQTVFHWSYFPTHAHKHADELGLSLWSDGQQWVRGVGYWPYDGSRRSAIGWRSSNAPHWLNESRLSERNSTLVGSAVDDRLAFFDVLRTNGDGSRIRRQLVAFDEGTWVVLDSFTSPIPKTAETVWRFPPRMTVEVAETGRYILNASGTRRSITMYAESSGPVRIDADSSGTAAWNSGMVADGDIASSPAIRMTSSAKTPVMLTVFDLDDVAEEATERGNIAWRWQNEWAWQFSLTGARDGDITVKRDSGAIRVLNNGAAYRDLDISTSIAESAMAPRQAALNALNRASENYGKPFQPMVERRIKVTLAIAAATLAQLILFVFLRMKHRSWWRPFAVCSSFAWIGLALYLGLSFLV